MTESSAGQDAGRTLRAERQGGLIVVGRRPELRRLDALAGKTNKTQPEMLEEILLRLRRMEEHLGIV